MAKIITAYVSDLLQQHLQGVISFSRMVELLNEKVNEPEPENITVFDSLDLSGNDKKNAIDQFIRLTTKHTLQLFMMLGLKTHIEARVVNEPTKEVFEFSFKKVEPKEPEVNQPAAYEYHNLNTEHCYVDYLPRPGQGKAEGYEEIPLFYKIA